MILIARQAAERLEAGAAYSASGYVACDELGAAVSPEWFTDEFCRVSARVGLPRIRLHDSRRTINSLMARAGVPPHIRAAWCGHTVAVNEVSYTFAQAEDLALALGAVSKIHSAVREIVRKPAPESRSGPRITTEYEALTCGNCCRNGGI